MDYELLQDVNVKASFLVEVSPATSDWDEPEPDIPNPIPVPGDAERGLILDAIDDIEGKYVDQVYEKLKAAGKIDPNNVPWGNIRKFVHNKLGKVQEVRIADLQAIEPNLYGDHLSRLAQGYTPTRNTSKYPIIYVLSSGKYIGDGNHRVVNELSKGVETLTALVIDFRRQEKEWL